MEIDDLEIALNGTSEVGVAAVDALIGALDKLQSSLGDISSPVNKAVKSLDKMTKAFDKIGSASGAVKGADQAAASMARVEKTVSSTAAEVSAAARGAAGNVGNATKQASNKLKQAAYQARLDAKVAAQEAIQQSRVTAARRIADIKATQQVKVAAEKAALAASKQMQSQESKAAEAEALMAAKRRQEEADWAALAQRAIARNNQNAYVPTAETTTPPVPETAPVPEPKESPKTDDNFLNGGYIGRSPEDEQSYINVLQRIQSAAAKAEKAVKSIFSSSRGAANSGISQLDVLKSKLDNANQGIALQQVRIRQLNKDWAAAFKASGMDNTTESVMKVNQALLSARKSLTGYQSEINRVTAEMSKLNNSDNNMVSGMNKVTQSLNHAKGSTDGLSRAFSRMGRQILSQLIVYSMIWPAIQSFGTYMWDSLKTNTAFANSLNNLKVQFLTAFQPIYQAALPALTSLITMLAKAMTYIAAFTSGLFGTTYAQSEKSAAGLNKNVRALEDTSKAAKKATKSLAAFDEINVLNKSTETSPKLPTGADKALTNTDFNAPSAKPLISEDQIKAAEKLGEKVRKIFETIGGIAGEIRKSLADITVIVSGFALAVGAILVLTGANVPLGLGLMVAGAVGLAMVIAVNWNSMTTPLLNVLTTITAAVGGFMLALGVIIALSGASIPLGIGLIMVGAASIATSIALNWGNVRTNITTVLSGITGAVSGASLALGALLALSGANIPLGIGLMVVGAIGIASTVALNWSTMSNQLKSTLTTITIIVGASMLALGALLTFTGVAAPLGIPMMIIGAASLATAVALNWNLVKDKIKSIIAEILSYISAASIVIGVILCLTGVGIPLGIGLIIAGIAGTITAAKIDKNPIVEFVKGLVNGIIDIINKLTDALNRLPHINVPKNPLFGVLSGVTIGFSIPKIPHLEAGGVLKKGQTGYLEGNGDEAVVPLQKNTGWIDALAEKLNSRGDSQDDGMMHVQINLDGRVIYETTKKYARRESRNSNSLVFDA